jgi:hypothetical protein
MSRGVMIYSVPPERLRQALGSRASALKAGLKLGSDPQSQATARFVDEGAVPDCDAGVRIHAFERLCEYLGRSLPNRSVSPVKLEFLEKVDQELEQLSFCLGISKLIYGGGPLRLPPADDFPTVGHADERLVELADEQRRAGLLKSRDEEVESVFVELGDWIEVAAARKDMLVGFCY